MSLNVTSLSDFLGPPQLPWHQLWPLTVLYLVIFVCGILGNVSVCVVIAKSQNLQTATSQYLLSLAASDLLLLLFGLPNDVILFWQQYPWTLGDFICKARALISEMSTNASITTIMAFTVHRYLAVCFPLTSHNRTRARRVVMATWLLSFISATPFAIYTRVHHAEFPPTSGAWVEASATCSIPWTSGRHFYRPLFVSSCLIFFILPMILICSLYFAIARALSLADRQQLGNTNGDRKRTTGKMLVAIVLSFFICWTPFHAQRLLFVYDTDIRHWPSVMRKVNEILYFAGALYYLNCTLNPIIYHLMSKKYRCAFADTWRTLIHRRGRKQNGDSRLSNSNLRQKSLQSRNVE